VNNIHPIVSVLMTAYNREAYIAEAIESVLASTLADFELIVVDDGSKDRTLTIAKTYEESDSRVRVYKNEKNLGDYPNRNKAASYATGKYIKYLDSDDIMYSHCLEVMVYAMEKYPEAAFGLSSESGVENPHPHCISSHDAYKEHFYGYDHFGRGPCSSIIRKEIFDAVGGFKSKKYVGDTELWFELAQKYHLVKLPRDLVWDRLHDFSEKVYEKAEKEYIEVRRKMIDYFMTHPDCPLTEEEKKEIARNGKRKQVKQNILANLLYIKSRIKS
jgi:glycosyltransferase involved in cell wall biosynthesis